MTTPHYDYDPEFIELYECAEFEREYRGSILAALRRIDRARASLIAAQNELVFVLQGSNDYSRDAFSHFYAAGGVGAQDWQAFDHACATPPRAIGRGQLRVVWGDRA